MKSIVDTEMAILDFFKKSSRDPKEIYYAGILMESKYVVKKDYDDTFDFCERDKYKAFNDTFFVPGKMYTFKNSPKDSKRYDGQPIVLCMRLGKDKKGAFMQGLNFHKLDPNAAATLMDKFVNLFRGEFELSINAAIKGETYISQNMVKALNNPEFVVKIFDTAVSACYSKFYLKDMENASLFELDDWKYIPLMRPMSLVGYTVKDLIEMFKKMSGMKISKKVKDKIKEVIDSVK